MSDDKRWTAKDTKDMYDEYLKFINGNYICLSSSLVEFLHHRVHSEHAQRWGNKFDSIREDMHAYAMMELIRILSKPIEFKEESKNPTSFYAYVATSIHSSFIRYIALEKQNRDVKKNFVEYAEALQLGTEDEAM